MKMWRGREGRETTEKRRDDITRPDLFPLSRVLAGRRGKKRGRERRAQKR